MKRFKGNFKVVKNGLIGKIFWWGKDTVGVSFYREDGSFYWSGEVFKTTIIGNFKFGNYEAI